MVTLHTFDGQTVNAINDARLYNFILNNGRGIAEGATVTTSGGLVLNVAAGWGAIFGRVFTIEAEGIMATPATSGTQKGRLLLQIDITNQAEPIQFITQRAATLPALKQENINGGGTVYQLPLAVYDVTAAAVTNLEYTAPQLVAPGVDVGPTFTLDGTTLTITNN